MKTYMTPEMDSVTLPSLHTIEIGASWPWGDMDPDETEMIG